MIYQLVILDNRGYIVEYKTFSEFDEDKLIDYAASRLEKLKNLYKIEIKRFDNE